MFQEMIRRWGNPMKYYRPGQNAIPSPLLAALNSGIPSRIKFLVDLGADPNESVMGTTPLLVAVQMESKPMTKALLEAGAKATEDVIRAAREAGWEGHLTEMRNASKASPSHAR